MNVKVVYLSLLLVIPTAVLPDHLEIREPTALDSDVVYVCLDDDGFRVLFDNGQTANQGENTTTFEEIFERSSDSGDSGSQEVELTDHLALDDCAVDIPDIEAAL